MRESEKYVDLFDDYLDEESDLSELEVSQLSEVVTWSTDWTMNSVVELLRRGLIELDPSFQRRNAWTELKQSRFIESVMLGLPIPQVVLAEGKSGQGRYIVIDGKQRLLSLMHFMAEDDPLQLKGLEFLKSLNGYTLAQIRADRHKGEFAEQFEIQTLRSVIVKNWQDERVLYLIFHRLNTGSVKLSPQELRRALIPGPVHEKLDSFIAEQSDLLGDAYRMTVPDFRMRDVEIVLRFLAFQMIPGKYRGNLKQFLDDVTKLLNAELSRGNETRVDELLFRFSRASIATSKIFGPDAYSRWKADKFDGRINRAVMDVMNFFFAEDAIAKAAIGKSQQVKSSFQELCKEDSDFLSSISGTTKSLTNTQTRFTRWSDALSSAISAKVSPPKLA